MELRDSDGQFSSKLLHLLNCSVVLTAAVQIQSDGIPLPRGKQHFVVAASAYRPGLKYSSREWEPLTRSTEHKEFFPFLREQLQKQTLLWMMQLRKQEMGTGDEEVLFKRTF